METKNKILIATLSGLIVILGIIILITWVTSVSVVGVLPEASSTTSTVYPEIKVTFSRNLSDNEKNNVSLTLNPSSINDVKWQNAKTAVFIPRERLLLQTTYYAKVDYGNSYYTWSFTTPDAHSVSQDEQAKIEGQNEAVYSNGWTKAIEAYPWYNKTPIVGPNYFIGFTGAEAKFTIFIYANKNSSIPVPTQESQIKSQALAALTGIGVDISKFKMVYVYQPK